MNSKQPVYILDSYALLAYLNNEAGMDRIQAILREAGLGKCRVLLSILNLGEVIYIIEREVGLPQAQEVLALLEQLANSILPSTNKTVLSAAHIKANYRHSYADAFAVVAAQENDGLILTGDPEFQNVRDLVGIEWLVDPI
jgi:predicted nucleic acid-binding protein